jgi:hypothetical protein
MATITGLTAARMLEIEAASVVDGDVVGNDLILARQDGSIINAGNVRGPAGPTGPMGSALSVVTAQQLLDVGQVGQIRAGRQLTPADFTNMGLSAPLGLWNLSNFNDSSGNARHLANKGSVPLGVGINGLASTAAVFAGSTGQALYVDAAGGSSGLNIRTGTIGGWFRLAKRGVAQDPMGRWGPTGSHNAWAFQFNSNNQFAAFVSSDGSANVPVTGTSDVVDDRWHFLVLTHDATKARVYVDGVLEGQANANFPIFLGDAPFTIGAVTPDGTIAAAGLSPYFGRVDEAFITSDVLSDEEIRNLYCASIPHALGVAPSVVNLAVRRRRRGAPIVAADFPSQPLRLHNFTGGSLADQGSANIPLVAVGGGSIVDVSGADGSRNGAKLFSGAHTGLGATDAGLPSGLAARSFGCWFKTDSATNQGMIGWGTLNTADTRLSVLAGGTLQFANGTDAPAGGVGLNTGELHFAVITEDNAAADGVKRKLYIDGRLVAGSTVMNSVTLAGANRFRIGAVIDGTLPFIGQIDAPFVYAGVLTPEQIRKLYDLSSQQLSPSPKDAAEHIEAVEAGRLLVVFDGVETCDQVDLAVMS